MTSHSAAASYFAPGSPVLATLTNPREKFFGTVLAIRAEGVVLCAVEVQSLDAFLARARSGEPVQAPVLFFPTHRIERLELDTANGDVPSMREHCESRSGRPLAHLFTPAEDLA